MPTTAKAKVLQGRLAQAKKLVPAVLKFCEEHGVEVKENDHGYQFRKAEYVILWSPRTNKVSVQYRIKGHGNTVTFKGKRSTVSKIMQALKSLAEILK